MSEVQVHLASLEMGIFSQHILDLGNISVTHENAEFNRNAE